MNWRLLIFSLLIFNTLTWGYIFYPKNQLDNLNLYFLDVGQGDSELISFDNVRILVDGGPGAQVLEKLSEILPITDRYIDLIILTHPHLDHFGGLIDVLKNYQVGVIIENGFTHDTSQFNYFEKVVEDKKIKRVALHEGDK